MKIKSMILSGILIVCVVIGTNIIYGVCNTIKTDQQKKNTPVSTVTALDAQENSLTPKQQEIAKYKSQLMFLISDDGRIGLVNQTVMDDMAKLLNVKDSGIEKLSPEDIKATQTAINTFWAQNNTFSSTAGANLKTQYLKYLVTLNNYLDEGIKTGELNVANLPKFPASSMTEINNDINNVKVQLTGLGSSLDLSSSTYFTVQNSGQQNTGY